MEESETFAAFRRDEPPFNFYEIVKELLLTSVMCKQKPQQSSSPSANLIGEQAVLVCNHVSYLDVIVLMALYQPSFMARYGVIEVPLVGWIAQAIQCLFLDPVGSSGQGATPTLSERMTCPQGLPPLVIFPEGTTTNGKYLVSFRAGAFRAGLPVRPVVIHYPYVHFSPAWEAVRTPYHMWRLLTQVTTYVHVTELPLYVPSNDERADPYLYARKVQKVMAGALGQPVADHLSRPHKLLYHQLLMGKVAHNDAEVEARRLTANDYARRKRGIKGAGGEVLDRTS